MKIEINEYGIMVITPENSKEDKQLHEWYLNNSNMICRKVIDFKRIKKDDDATVKSELINALQTYLNAGSKEQRKEASVIAKRALSKALN